MDVKLINKYNEFVRLKKEIVNLQKRSNNSIFYNSYEFIESYIKYFLDKDEELFIICVQEGEMILGLAPLIIKKIKALKCFDFRILKFIAKGDYLDFLVQEDNNQTIIKKIFEYINYNSEKWDRLVLNNIYSKSNLMKFLLKDKKYNEKIQNKYKSPYLMLSKYKTIEELKKVFPKNSKKFSNKLKKDINYKFKVINNEVSNSNIIYKLKNIYQKEQNYLIKEKGRNRVNLLESDIYIKFIKELFEKGLIEIFILTTEDNEIITYNMCYKFNNVLYSWNTGYDPKYIKYQLSKVRYYNIFNYLFQNFDDKLTFDFGIKGYTWKFEWANEWNEVYEFELWNYSRKIVKILKNIDNLKLAKKIIIESFNIK